MTSKLTVTDDKLSGLLSTLEKSFAGCQSHRYTEAADEYADMISALRELQERRNADSEPVAEVVSIYGDPEAFGEREIRPLVGIQQMPYGTKLYRHAQPGPVVDSEPVVVPDHLTYIQAPTLENILSDTEENSPMSHAARILAREVKFWRSAPLYHHAQPAKSLELAGWQFKSVNGDWLGLIDENGKNQAVR